MLRSIVWCAQQGETYRWAICKEPLPLVEMRHAGIPLPAKHVEVLHPSLAWEDLQVLTLPSTLLHYKPVLAHHCTGCFHLRPYIPFPCKAAALKLAGHWSGPWKEWVRNHAGPWDWGECRATGWLCAVQWCNIGVILKGKALPFARVHWTARTQP